MLLNSPIRSPIRSPYQHRAKGLSLDLPLDPLSVESSAAYSLRKLRNAYTGNAIRVRRSSDNAEQNIGFASNGDLDTAALLAHVGYQNLVARSEELEDGYWSSDATTPTLAINSAVAPDGTTTAEKMMETATLSPHNRYVVLGSQPAGTYTWSIFAKAAERNLLRVSLGTGGLTFGVDAYFNLSTGTIANGPNAFGGATNTQATITDAGNGWYRCSVTVAMNAGQIIPGVWIRDAVAGANYTGVAGNGLLLWGAQLNTGSVAQPYQATTSSALLGNGFVTTWYDQSGNGRNATQATAGNQPQIVASGAIETQNGRPALRFDGVNDFFVMTSPINSANATINAVSRLASMGSDGGYILGSLTPLGVLGYDDGSLGLRIFSSSGGYFASPLPAAVILAAAVDTIVIASNVAALHRYGVSIAGTQTIGQNFQPTNIGTYGNGAFGRFWLGTLSEITVFGSSISTTDRQTLESNEGAYYGITVV